MIVRTAILTLMAASLAMAADPLVGKWKSDPSKAKPSPGQSGGFRSDGIMTREAVGKDHYRTSWSTKDGKPAVSSEGPIPVGDLYLDGKEHPTRAGAATTAVRIDERHVRITAKSAKGTSVSDEVVSADGKTMTMTRKGVGASTGRVIDEVFVFTKQ